MGGQEPARIQARDGFTEATTAELGLEIHGGIRQEPLRVGQGNIINRDTERTESVTNPRLHKPTGAEAGV